MTLNVCAFDSLRRRLIDYIKTVENLISNLHNSKRIHSICELKNLLYTYVGLLERIKCDKRL